MKQNVVTLLFLSLLASWGNQALAQESTLLPASVLEALTKAGLTSTDMGVFVTPLHSDDDGLVLHPEQAMSPASTMKLLTSVIALDQLGPNFRWKTQLLSEQAAQAHRLRGNLYLRGGGAPDFTWEKLAYMLRQLRLQGIREIQGDLVLDRSYFNPARFDLTLPHFDDSPEAYYNVIPDALLVSSNLIELRLLSNQKKLKIQTLPPLSNFRLENHLRLNDANCADWEKSWRTPRMKAGKGTTIRMVLEGEFPRNCKINTELNVLDKNSYIAHLTRQLWRELGGIWKGKVREGISPKNAQLLLEQNSATLADNLKVINKRSDNAMTRLLYLSLGEHARQQQAQENTTPFTSFQLAEQVVRTWMTQHHIDSSELVLENGSGLSRLERISPRQMASVLRVCGNSLWFPELLTSLPIAGVDGTMRKRLIGSQAQSRARIKTGTLRDTTAIAGYVLGQSNRYWIVAAMINHENAAKGRAALDALIEWIASRNE